MEYRLPQPAPRTTRNSSFVYVMLIFLLGFAVARLVSYAASLRVHDPEATPRPIVARGDLAEDEKSTIELFRRGSPAVVYITTARIGFDARGFDETTISQGTGSGFVWSQEGYIVTNDHVISDANLAQVTLHDQTVWKAKLVGRASATDLAVLKIDAPAERLQPIDVGRSNDLQVGQKVFAIGNPFGLDYTLTTGVISALDREIKANERSSGFETRRTIDGVIQTDAAINPGNSGGPLLDSAGRLIGVNTAIFSPSGAYAGVGFAIPADTVNRIVPELIRFGEVIRPSIGVVPFRDQLTDRMGIQGVLIRAIYRGSPAEKAGLRGTARVLDHRGVFPLGDVIVSANGKVIENLDDWYSFLESQHVGDSVTLEVLRDYRTSRQRKEKVDVSLVGPME